MSKRKKLRYAAEISAVIGLTAYNSSYKCTWNSGRIWLKRCIHGDERIRGLHAKFHEI